MISSGNKRTYAIIIYSIIIIANNSRQMYIFNRLHVCASEGSANDKGIQLPEKYKNLDVSS